MVTYVLLLFFAIIESLHIITFKALVSTYTYSPILLAKQHSEESDD